MLRECEEALAKQLAEMRGKKRKLVYPLQYALSIAAKDLTNYVPTFAWEIAPPSEKQLAFLERRGTFPDTVQNARLASLLIDKLKRHQDEGLATPNQIRCLERYGFRQVGAWIRFNPLDGDGVKNENVTKFRLALVESDTLSIAEQDILYRKPELPIAALMHSGDKSLHAIVHVDAENYEKYRKRVSFLYDFLEKNGVTIDKQNRNPSVFPNAGRHKKRQPSVSRRHQYRQEVLDGLDGFCRGRDGRAAGHDTNLRVQGQPSRTAGGAYQGNLPLRTQDADLQLVQGRKVLPAYGTLHRYRRRRQVARLLL